MNTDTTVYPPPSGANGDAEPESKKRKLNDGVLNGKAAHDPNAGARYTNQVLASQHVQEVHDIVKKECEDLADCIVSIGCLYVYTRLARVKTKNG